jgi:pyrroline-5-carboxylate reductase
MNNEAQAPIAFIGGGNMAHALISGLLRQGVPVEHLRVGEPEPAARAALAREFALSATADNQAAIEGAAMVVLAVKPQVAARVLEGMRTALLTQQPVLLSIMAGVRIADLARLCPRVLPIVRAMPNRPALVGAGITGLYAGADVTPAQRALAEQVAGGAGRSVWLRAESELDIVTAVSGSGPAYFFLLAEQLAQAAIALGLDRDTAALLATETLHGSGAMARGVATLAEQRAAVTSKGGTTEAALKVLQAGGFEALVGTAVRAGAARSAELAAAASAAIGKSSSTAQPSEHKQ